MGKYQRDKGARGERDLRDKMKEVMGWKEVERTQQRCGNAGDEDVRVAHLPDLFAECKWVEALNVVAAMKKAVEQCKGKLPVVFHRRSRTEWLVTFRLADMPRFLAVLSQPMPPEPSDPTIEPPSSSASSDATSSRTA